MIDLDDTIAAIASAPGGAARGIVRASGPQVLAVIQRCFALSSPNVQVQAITEPCIVSGQLQLGGAPPLPTDLFLWPTRRSYTRQPLAEFHTFGSPPLLQLALQTICAAGARLAQPGEFTLRAFLAGRIDLTQAEAVLGVVDSIDRRQLNTALDQLAGGLSRPLQQLRDDLLNLLADLEAGLDFAEEDIRFVSIPELDRRLSAAHAQLHDLSARLTGRSEVTTRPRVALVGRPNVGKSSLFNALVQQSAALVSAQPGTTRDYLSAPINAAGLPVELIDTAGLVADSQPDSIGQFAQTAALAEHHRADLRLLCLEAARPLNAWEQAELSQPRTLAVFTKCDLTATPHAGSQPGILTSSRTLRGLEDLRHAIRQALAAEPNDIGFVAGTVARATDSLRLATEALDRARQLAANQAGEELLAAELRLALLELGKIAGAVYTDDLLDRIFSRFCIGK